MTQDITNQRFGRLVALYFAGRNHSGNARWMCMCDCGTEKICTVSNLRNGGVRSCGCLRVEVRREYMLKHRHLFRRPTPHRKHGARVGGAQTPEYYSWSAMLSRCTNPNRGEWKYYGGRGVQVCDRWRGKEGFSNFLADMGLRPSADHSLDRFPNNAGNYEPGNCRWATQTEQNRNKRKAALSAPQI